MKGRLLTIEEIERIEEGTVYVESENLHAPTGIYNYNKNDYFINGKGNRFFRKCGAIILGQIKVYEYIEEPKTYKTSEMIAMLEENPKLSFEDEDGFKIDFHEILNRKWTLVEEPKEVTFLEAIKAFSEGKTIKNDYELIYKKSKELPQFDLKDNGGRAICANEILNGKWYVED